MARRLVGPKRRAEEYARHTAAAEAKVVAAKGPIHTFKWHLEKAWMSGYRAAARARRKRG